MHAASARIADLILGDGFTRIKQRDFHMLCARQYVPPQARTGRPRHKRSTIWSVQTTQTKRGYASDPVGSSIYRTRTSDVVQREVRDTKGGTTVGSSLCNTDDPSRFVATSPHWVLFQYCLHGEAVSLMSRLCWGTLRVARGSAHLAIHCCPTSSVGQESIGIYFCSVSTQYIEFVPQYSFIEWQPLDESTSL